MSGFLYLCSSAGLCFFTPTYITTKELWWLFQGRTEIPWHQKTAPRNIRFPSPWLYFMLFFLGPTPQNNIFCPNWKCVGRVVICGNANSKWIFDSLLELQVLLILRLCIKSYFTVLLWIEGETEVMTKLGGEETSKGSWSVVGSHGSLHKCDRGDAL